MFYSVIASYQEKRKGIIFSSFDIRKFYDSELLSDCLNEIYNSSVKGKVYRLIYHMNKNVRIKVNTPVGVTDSANTGPTLAQGSVEAGVISSVGLDNGMKVTFLESDGDNVLYIDLPIPYQLFMDDGNKMTEKVEAAQEANNKIEDLLECKLLDLNLDKSNYILIGSKRARKNLHQQIENKPLTLCNNPMKEVKTLKEAVHT